MQTPRTTYILIDHENIHSIDPGKIDGLAVKVLVFLGQQTTKLAVSDVQNLLKHRAQIELVTISGHGKNALDFHIAYYAGRISVEDPLASIHIISRDKGFDPLITHLKSRKMQAQRTESMPGLPRTRKDVMASLPADSRAERVISHLTKIAKARPRKRKTLASNIAAHFSKQLTDEEVAGLIADLENAGKLLIDEKETVTYRL
jgi:PIN domain